ncbi:hypothetical protein MCB86_08750 [Pseudomonas sp. KSR10]|uniref:hypothetical protein n=1 Tax=Pseudomonas sp. KSR10 TaxID=2916654 RepID=UPI001EF83194|nr:hypothetical protein [Pseudomonas sp. KSR10]MCG6540163.1 hypothetical protein [Pseudomonas sp. KSR10]
MAENWPSELYPSQMTWGCVYNSRAFTSSLSNAQQIVSYPGAYWRCSMRFNSMSQERERRLTAMLGRLQGMAGTINVPTDTRTRADDIGTPAVSSAATNAFAIGMTGISVNGRAFSAGDYITIGGQLFEVVEDAIASGGSALVRVNKRIRSTIAPGTPVEYKNPYCEMRLSNDSFSVDMQQMSAGSAIEMREAF